jgi:pimeloyl-ACP methyl ester carboxylesterase
VAEDIRALVEHLGGKALIVGHDWGGAVAQAFALQHPEIVSGVILMNVPMIATFNGVIGANKEQPSLAVYTLPYLGYQPGDDKNVDFITRNIRDPEWRSTIANYLKEEPIESMFSYYKVNYPAPPYKLGRDAARPAQGADRVGQRRPPGLPRTFQDSEVHSAWHWCLTRTEGRGGSARDSERPNSLVVACQNLTPSCQTAVCLA